MTTASSSSTYSRLRIVLNCASWRVLELGLVLRPRRWDTASATRSIDARGLLGRRRRRRLRTPRASRPGRRSSASSRRATADSHCPTTGCLSSKIPWIGHRVHPGLLESSSIVSPTFAALVLGLVLVHDDAAVVEGARSAHRVAARCRSSSRSSALDAEHARWSPSTIAIALTELHDLSRPAGPRGSTRRPRARSRVDEALALQDEVGRGRVVDESARTNTSRTRR